VFLGATALVVGRGRRRRAVVQVVQELFQVRIVPTTNPFAFLFFIFLLIESTSREITATVYEKLMEEGHSRRITYIHSSSLTT
jgi:hypothetical protein